MQLVLTSELLLEAYKQGLFPMAYSAHSRYIHWICPEQRGQLPIDEIHIPERLMKTLRSAPYKIRINTAFKKIMESCAENTENRPETWINQSIVEAYCKLHEQGHAHSIECWKDDELVGGLYGIAIGGAFFGESMFSRRRDASKIALIHLAARLWEGRFAMLDTQFINDHLKQFGAYELSHKEYMKRLEPVLKVEADFLLPGMKESDLLEKFFEMREKY